MKKKRVAIITGGARRIGEEISRTFHQKGYDIAIHYNKSKQDAERLAQELNIIRDDSAATFKAELGSVIEIKSMVKSILLWRKKIDALINNASSFFPCSLVEAGEKEWDILINSNLKGPYFVININDIFSFMPLENYSIYSIAKAGNRMLTKTLAKELAPKIRVNGIAPGLILWPDSALQMEEETRQKIMKSIPLQRNGSVQDIAKTALFLATSASYITGQTIVVDGGSSI
jgi:pteridine reductase